MPGLGRIHVPDPRDANYPLRALVAPEAPLKTRYWRTGPTLDQGQTPECVGYGWRDWLNASPIMDKSGNPPTADNIYQAAQQIDGIPLPHEGSTVRAGAQVMQSQGRLAEYRWAANLNDVLQWLSQSGTVVLGTVWQEAMFTPDQNGVVHLGGGVAGGHCYLAIGLSVEKRMVRCLNSWGNWGQRGRFWLHWNDLEGLLADDGEACAAVEKRP
jgi:hypothetical protein